MEQWTGNAIRQTIDELIEESYLRTLTDDEIRSDMRAFLDACDSVLSNSLSIHEAPSAGRLKVTLLRARLLLRPACLSGMRQGDVSSDGMTDHEYLACRVVRMKHGLMELFDACVPSGGQLVRNELKSDITPYAVSRGHGRRDRFVAGFLCAMLIVTALAFLLKYFAER